MKCLLTYLLLIAFIDWALGARILAVLPITSRSHHNLFHGILKALAKRGHQVVNYSPFPLDKPMANYKDIKIEIESVEKRVTKEQLLMLMNFPPVKSTSLLWKQSHFLNNTFDDVKFKELIKSNEKFDLLILEALFGQEGLLGLGHKFNIPVIILQPFGAFSLVNKLSGNPLSLAYIPDFAFPCSDHMSFYDRLFNAYSILGTLYDYYMKYLPTQDECMRNYFKDPTMPPLVDMLHNISLFVNNAHPNIHYAQPYTPNIIPVGGIHLSLERKALPPAMQKFLDEAKDGVIYFSLGSFLPDHLLPQEYFDNFINVFRKLPQRVLWKTGSEHSNLPDNVMTAKWMPQQDILAHPNVIVFMTHGGLFGQHEAISAGVPVVCTPYFGDQPLNAKFYEDHEIGVKLPFATLSEKTIYAALTTVINDKKYNKNMKKLSQIYHDRPISPADSLVFWVEYVLRHRGANHLRPASATMPWYQLALLDVFAVLFGGAAIVIVILYLVTRKFFILIRGKKNVISDKKKSDRERLNSYKMNLIS